MITVICARFKQRHVDLCVLINLVQNGIVLLCRLGCQFRYPVRNQIRGNLREKCTVGGREETPNLGCEPGGYRLFMGLSRPMLD